MTREKIKYAIRRIVTVTLVAVMAAVNTIPVLAVAASTDDQEEPATAATYSVKYEYDTSKSGDLPEAVTKTLPVDDKSYEDGTTVKAEDPSDMDIEDGGRTYTFDGWDEPEKKIEGADITFTGTWTVEEDEPEETEDYEEETVFEDEDSYDPNPAPPAALPDKELVTMVKNQQLNGKGTHIATFNGDYGSGLCCYHNRKAAKAGAQGWMRKMKASESHYEDIRRCMYWGMYKVNDKPSLGHAFSIHIMLSYWRNGNKSLTKNTKSGTSRFKTAQKYCNSLIAKGAPPENFSIYEWIGTGANNKKQIVISYKLAKNGYVKLKKQPAATATDFLKEAPNNYSLSGAVYELYTDAACTQRAYDTDYNYVTFTTDANGDTKAVEVEANVTYYAKEKTASKGFRLDTSARSVSVSTANTAANPAVITSTEEPAYSQAAIELEKASRKDGWKRLIGTQYRLSYYDITPGTDPEGKTPKRSWIVETKEKQINKAKSVAALDFGTDELADGSDDPYLVADSRVLPLGVFSIEEIKAPDGLARDEKLHSGKVYQPSNGAAAEVSFYETNNDNLVVDKSTKISLTHLEEEQHIVIEVNKLDSETKDGKAQGTDRENVKGSLAGAVYNVYFDSDRLPEPELVGTITTDENGKGTLEKQQLGSMAGEYLDPGEYLIEEVQASPGYTLDKLFYEDNKGVYENGRHLIRAKVKESQTASFAYTVESKEQPHHTYISKTDVTTGKELPGTKLEVYDSEGNLVESWTSGTKPHDIVALHDETQGLKDGKYTLREITAPYGYDVAEDINFEVKSGTIANIVRMQNKPVTIDTTATDAETETHQGTFNADALVTDRVVITGLYKGRTYRLSGRLIDKSTKAVVKDKDGNDSTAVKEFTATGDTVEIDLTFRVDASAFDKGMTTVAFERLERTSKVHEVEADVVPVEISRHEDPEDDDQTIHYGGIVRTVATAKNMKSHDVYTGKKVTVIDTIEYTNLSTKERYTVEGELYDKKTGKLTGIKARTDFTPQTPSGKVEVWFMFDATELKDHSLVAFEELSLNGRLIDSHRDPDDADQTIHIKESPFALPETGDNTKLWLYGGVFAAAFSGFFSFVIREFIRRRRQASEDAAMFV